MNLKTLKLNINKQQGNQKVNEECNLGIGFDNTFKAENHIFVYNKEVKDYRISLSFYQERLEKLGLSTLLKRRIRWSN